MQKVFGKRVSPAQQVAEVASAHVAFAHGAPEAAEPPAPPAAASIPGVVETVEPLQDRLDHKLEEQGAFVEAWNGKLPSPVAPWPMIPLECWRGELASFLMSTLRVYPTDDWNVMLLPTDERGALMLELPQHPRKIESAYLGAAIDLVSQLRDDVMTKHNGTVDDSDAMTGVKDAAVEARTKLEGIAAWLAARHFGDAAVERNRKMFFGGA